MIDVFTTCPMCGYAGHPSNPALPPNPFKICPYKATDVPLRCQHAADLAEYARWNRERYTHTDGKEYLPVTKREPIFDPADPTKQIGEHNVIDLEPTLAAGPIEPPKTILHVHRACKHCEWTWVEPLEGGAQ